MIGFFVADQHRDGSRGELEVLHAAQFEQPPALTGAPTVYAAGARPRRCHGPRRTLSCQRPQRHASDLQFLANPFGAGTGSWPGELQT
jgi:hypothetical protein